MRGTVLADIKCVPAFADYGNSEGAEVTHRVEVEAIFQLHLNRSYVYDNFSGRSC